MASASVSMKANLNELDAMLHDLSRGQYNSHLPTDKDVPPERPPPPKGYTTNNENQNPTLQSNSSSNFLQVKPVNITYKWFEALGQTDLIRGQISDGKLAST